MKKIQSTFFKIKIMRAILRVEAFNALLTFCMKSKRMRTSRSIEKLEDILFEKKNDVLKLIRTFIKKNAAQIHGIQTYNQPKRLYIYKSPFALDA